jgi:hypothetical protein
VASENQNLDRVLWGAEAIGAEAGLFKVDGTVDCRKTFYLLEKGLLPGKRIGRQWTSTVRHIREHFADLSAVTTNQKAG